MLAGPLLHRVEPILVSVWIALEESGTFKLFVGEGEAPNWMERTRLRTVLILRRRQSASTTAKNSWVNETVTSSVHGTEHSALRLRDSELQISRSPE